MAKSTDRSSEDSLPVLRAELETAQAAAAGVPEDAPEEHKAKAAEIVANAEAALRDAHLDAQKREAPAIETREEVPDEAPEEVVVVVVEEPQASLWDIVNSASNQNVRGTDALSPEEHAKRRNPSP